MTDLTGKIVLGSNQYGQAENRVVRIYRDSPRHEIHDINVSSALRGDFSPAHLVGDLRDPSLPVQLDVDTDAIPT